MPGSIFGFPTRPTTGQGMVWSEELGGYARPGSITATGATLSGFTSTRVALGSVGGGLTDSANLTFDGTTLSLTGALSVTDAVTLTTASSGLTIAKTSGKTLIVSSTDAATSTSTGCATFAGGIGVALSLYVGDTAAGSASILQCNGKLDYGNSQTAYQTAEARPTSYSTNASGAAYPFLEAGNLVHSPRISGASRDVIISSRGTAADFIVDRNQSIRCGEAALATNATNGFLYVRACAGTPTGAPTSVTGLVPIVVDSTNNKLYFYSGGAWRDAGP